MANEQALYDANRIPTLIGEKASAPGETARFKVNDHNGGLMVSDAGGGSLWTLPYDYISAAYPDAVTEVYTSKQGGSGGSIQEVVTVVYTDSSKDRIQTVTRI